MTDYPRQHIAAAVSDLRHMRGRIEDLKTIGYGLLGGYPDAPADVRANLILAMEAAETASQIAQERMRRLYNQPTPTVANDDEAEAA
ncbi:hypothetical protein ACC685_33395 [Rhizobium ruizarguesonis]